MEKKMEIIISVDYSVDRQTAIKQGGFKWVSPDLISPKSRWASIWDCMERENDPPASNGDIKIVLLRFGESMQAAEAALDIRREGLRPATLREAVALAAYPDIEGEIVAPGEVCHCYRYGKHRVMVSRTGGPYGSSIYETREEVYYDTQIPIVKPEAAELYTCGYCDHLYEKNYQFAAIV